VQASDSPQNPDASRADRLARRRGWRRRFWITGTVVVLAAGGGVAAYALVSNADTSSAGTRIAAQVPSSQTSAKPRTVTKKVVSTTTTTVPPVKQPRDVKMPPPGRLSYGSRSPILLYYEARMKDLHFDPGPVDGVFDQDTQYAVIAVQKYFGQTRTGVIDTAVQWVLSKFRYTPALPHSEPDRVEVDLDRQVITVYKNWQPILLTTTSTGSGEYFCGGADGCQYAITPAGHYHFYELDKGWKDGKLGKMWNPYFFNGGIAIHGLASVPPYPASHGCARIPMHVADYFYTLVNKGESVFVVGTPKKAGNAYVGPIKSPPTTTTPTTAKPAPTPTTKKPTTTTTKKKPASSTTSSMP
jgi:peptidoglycan hydrolase-like protein with peptidoglycan-binding domain